MFDLVITESAPPAAVREAAIPLLANIVSTHATLALADVLRRRSYLRAEIAADSQRRLRILQVDLERAEWLLGHLDSIRAAPVREAEVRIDPLLQLVGGPLQAIELTREFLAARVPAEQAGGHPVRIFLGPEENSRRRVQIQDIRRADPQTLRDATPRCYGDTGLAYIGWALNRLDLRTLILVTLAYLRVN